MTFLAEHLRNLREKFATCICQRFLLDGSFVSNKKIKIPISFLDTQKLKSFNSPRDYCEF